MPRFKLREGAGSHVESPMMDRAHKVYHAKDQEFIDSDEPLDELFFNKFERVEGGGGALEEVRPTTFSASDPVATSMPNLGKTVRRVAEDQPDPDDEELHEEKQEERRGKMKKEAAKSKKRKESSKSKKETVQEERDEEEKSQGLGDDVTHDFEGAADEGLKVFKDEEGNFHVADDAKPDKALNKEELDEKGVKRFLKDLGEG